MALAALWLLPALAAADLAVTAQVKGDETNQIVLFSAERAADGAELSEEEKLAQDMRLMMVSGALSMRLGQARAQQLYDAAQSGAGVSLHQTAYSYVDEKLASLAIVWQGTQPDGTDACRPYSVTIDLETGFEIGFDQLFADAAGAVEAMEAIIETDILDDMNAYIEAADLLPMPTNCFSFDEIGLTVYYDDIRYRMFDGRSGHVTFYWHELAAFIGEDSPVYAISRPQEPSADSIRGANGRFDHALLSVHEPLGAAMAAYDLTDEPDYTTYSLLYPLSQPAFRGMAVEIPKYAETDEEDTPICAVRHSRISWHGLTTGVTTREEVITLLGEPDDTHLYGEDEAFDMMLEPGESLLYRCDQAVLQAHLDEDGVLSCLILRDAMPESLY